MELLQLQHYLVLCDTLNYRAASDQIYTSPSTLSRSIKRLEEETGCPLFTRDNREVRLTSQGRLFREWAMSVLDSYKQFQYRIMEEHKILTGELSIFGSVTAYYSVMSGIIEGFRTRYPEVHLKLQTGSPVDAAGRVEKNEVDLGITMYQENFRESLVFLPVTTTPLVFIAPAGFTQSGSSIDWGSHPMILPSKGPGRERVDKWFFEKGAVPNMYAQVEGNEAILAMVSLNCGIGVVPKLVLDKSPLNERIKIISTDRALEPYIVGLIAQRKRLQNPLVKSFWELVKELNKK